MSVYNLWDNDIKGSLLKNSLSSSEWNFKSPLATPRSTSPPSRVGEAIFSNYLELIKSKSEISTDAKQTEPQEKPFDFFDDEEFAFGINLLNNNIACVGDNITKLIQMAQEPWPENVKLFQPYEVEQILLPDNASCLAVQAFLKMCNLPFEVEMRWNAEFMSPSGRVPFIKCGAFVVSELEPIVQFAANKGVSLCARLGNEEKAEMRAYMSLITNVLVNAELYISWIDNETFNTVTKVRNSSVYPWPLGWLQTRAKRNNVAKRLKALHWHDKTLDQVLADVEQCCNSLSQRLGEKDYFFGTPSPLDALTCGHVRALLSVAGPKAALVIRPITSSLLRHVLRMTKLTGMALTPQEDYLLTQAFQVSYRRRMSPERSISERSARARRSKMSIRNTSRDSVAYNRDVFGFQPFASKKIIIMTSKEGTLTCEYNGTHKIDSIDEEHYKFVIEIMEDVLDKVEEIYLNEKQDVEKDFEVIAFPNQDTESKYESIDVDRYNEFMSAGEADIMSMSLGGLEDAQIINEDSDGLVNDKHLASEIIVAVVDDTVMPQGFLNVEGTDISTNFQDEFQANSDRDSLTSAKITKSATSIRSSGFSSESKSTLMQMPSDEEISVENLLNFLRQRNACYHCHTLSDVVDVD